MVPTHGERASAHARNATARGRNPFRVYVVRWWRWSQGTPLFPGLRAFVRGLGFDWASIDGRTWQSERAGNPGLHDEIPLEF